MAPTVPGVMHCYSGSAEQLPEFLSRGFFISFGGPVTFSNARKPLAALRAVPIDRLLLETDAPDLTPEPLKGFPNEPSFLPFIAEAAAAVKQIEFSELCERTYENSRRLFGF
ncbi:MAG: hypothetical protein Kow00107_03340 [Planctomycetota bacterium]